MATALTHITNAMTMLSKLAPGGTPSSDEQTFFLPLLNNMLESWQAQRMNGFNRTVAVSGKSTDVSISGDVITLVEVGGTTTTVVNPNTISTYASIGTNNTYPTGWDEAIQTQFALKIAPMLGVKPAETLVAQAQSAFAAIKPPEPPVE